MKHVVMLVLLVVGVQGGIRLLLDHDNAGILGWVPGGFPAHLACYVVMAVVGGALAARGGADTRTAGDRDR
ncbi:hypothetical protein [Actinoplanes regularis]|uniref:Uncharacterized protein n=1 Tax=Actinoplanes regularis TaxID=52697 RepID=A0A239BYQ8_9ACTN|nr:hypothetical protein [Actinoplanes regularis]GIE88206.1 hypothetical protein Are01nite_46860 [Actinoplanes regularis]SNS13046.1 hypothetical protein SAMN06264365_110209 [Actinoplanes regularis]